MKRKMATKHATLVHVDEDYIDMELCSSPPNNFSYSINSTTSNREFEFQMTSKNSSTSPADDLFYQGKLLPLHLPPRLQMVQNLLENSNNANFVKSNSTFQDTNFIDLRIPSTNTTLEPFNISPSESCRFSSDLSSNENKFEWSSSSSTTTTTFIGDLPKKSWPKKLKQMKQLLLGQRLKASRSYLKTLFNKSGCSDNCASATNNTKGSEKRSKCKECPNKYNKVSKTNNPFEISCAVFDREMLLEDDFNNHRRSFSGVGQRHCAIKSSSLSTSSSGSSSSSSSFSFSSAGYYDLQLFKRSISANYELEGSIEGAIAHCKQSQQQCCSKNGSDGSRICSQFETKMQLVEVKK